MIHHGFLSESQLQIAMRRPARRSIIPLRADADLISSGKGDRERNVKCSHVEIIQLKVRFQEILHARHDAVYMYSTKASPC